MKKSILMFCFSFLALCSFGQTINGIDDIKDGYMRIIITEDLNSANTKPIIKFDFAENSGIPKKAITEIKDENNKLLTFNTGLDALNFFTQEFLFTLVHAYAVSTNNNIIQYYILKID